MTAAFRTIGLPDSLFHVVDGSFDLDVRHAFSDTIFNTFVRASGPVIMLWGCKLAFATQHRGEKNGRAGWQEWQGFKARLAGQVTLFTLRAPFRNLPLGAGAGYARTNPAYAITGTTITGTTIRTGAVTAKIARVARRDAQSVMMDFGADMAGEVVLKVGDLWGLGGNLYLTTGRVTADSAGVARVPFRAPLWKGAKIGDLVNFDKPTVRMQLKTPNEGALDLTVPALGHTGFSAAEVPYT